MKRCMMKILLKKIGEFMNKKINRYFLIILLMLLVGTGCNSQVEHKNSIIKKLNKITKMEEDFEKAGEKIQELEIQELECYEKIYSFKQTEIEERQSTASEAIRLLEERKVRIEEESNLIHEIDIKIRELQTLNNETKDDQFQKDVNQFAETWKKRTNLYDKLNEKYHEAIKVDLSIYNKLSQKKVDLKEVKNMTRNTNVIYKDVIKMNDKLNLYSQKLNELRKQIVEKYGK
jgi:Putative cell-wall binding lipoprotein